MNECERVAGAPGPEGQREQKSALQRGEAGTQTRRDQLTSHSSQAPQPLQSRQGPGWVPRARGAEAGQLKHQSGTTWGWAEGSGVGTLTTTNEKE